ncbi:hypothetical protein [Ferrovibrio sp.]|uniref:hypothetical protein n=1 Tax=Ferrovibrio sp. TaxID=1917215 RepID=UPI00311E8FCE
MTPADWLQLAALAMVVLLILPRMLRLPWRSPRLLQFAALWLAIFLAVALLYRLFGT